MKPSFYKGIVLGAAVAILVLVASTAVAGTGIGGIFNLGQTNTVNATSALSGASVGAQLQVTNSGTGSGAQGIGAFNNSVAATLYGRNSGGGPGVSGRADKRATASRASPQAQVQAVFSARTRARTASASPVAAPGPPESASTATTPAAASAHGASPPPATASRARPQAQPQVASTARTRAQRLRDRRAQRLAQVNRRPATTPRRRGRLGSRHGASRRRARVRRLRRRKRSRAVPLPDWEQGRRFEPRRQRRCCWRAERGRAADARVPQPLELVWQSDLHGPRAQRSGCSGHFPDPAPRDLRDQRERELQEQRELPRGQLAIDRVRRPTRLRQSRLAAAWRRRLPSNATGGDNSSGAISQTRVVSTSASQPTVGFQCGARTGRIDTSSVTGISADITAVKVDQLNERSVSQAVVWPPGSGWPNCNPAIGLLLTCARGSDAGKQTPRIDPAAQGRAT